MIVSADLVLPVSRPPISGGAVRVHNGRITDVGTVEQVTRRFPDDETRHFAGCAMTPGLVNAHTHLALSAMEGLFPPMAFDEWIPRLVRAMRSWTPDDFAASAKLGAQRCLEAGVTVVGDIAYGPEAPAAASDVGLGGVFFWEVLGIDPSEVRAALDRLEFPSEKHGRCGPRLRCGLSPHALYSSGPALLKHTHELAARERLPFAMHVAESAAEVALVRDGSGPLAAVAERLAPDFKPSGRYPVSYLDSLGVLDSATVIHVCQTFPTDIPRLAATVRGAVTCPRSNAWLSTGSAPVERMLRAGISVGIGTDSSASNEDLDLMEDVRALAAGSRRLSARDLLHIATIGGARALGIEESFGSLEAKKQADLALFELDANTETAEAEFVATAGRSTLRAVMSAGGWRILDGRLIAGKDIQASVSAARERARKALAQQ